MFEIKNKKDKINQDLLIELRKIKWKKIWCWTYRDVFNFKENDDFIIKVEKNKNIEKQFSNKNELKLNKYFNEIWLSYILTNIDFEKSNNEFIVLEKIKPLKDLIDLKSNLRYLKSDLKDIEFNISNLDENNYKFYWLKKDKENLLNEINNLENILEESNIIIWKLKDENNWNKDILNFIKWKNLSENKNLWKKKLINFFIDDMSNNEYDFSNINYSNEFLQLYNLINKKELSKLEKENVSILIDVISDLNYTNIWYDNNLNIKILDYWG